MSHLTPNGTVERTERIFRLNLMCGGMAFNRETPFRPFRPFHSCKNTGKIDL